MKTEDEKRFSEFFISRLNLALEKRYSLRLNPDQSGDKHHIDAYAECESESESENFYLQLTTKEAILFKTSADLEKKARKTGQLCVMGPVLDMNIYEWVSQAILKKSDYTPKERRQLVLLVVGEHGPLMDKESASRLVTAFRLTDFKGIYYVHMPISKIESNHPHEGQVVAIKDIWNNHGISF